VAGTEVVPFRRRHFERILEIESTVFAGEPYSTELFHELWEDCGDWFFVAKQSGRIAGYIVGCRTSWGAEIVSIAVEGPYQRRGIGKALMSHMLAEMRKVGVRAATLMVRATNMEAIRFYRSLDFSRTGTVRNYYLDGEAAYRMRKVL
jgi:ribosomal-protein-alanine N-acetyltransferase